MPPKNLGPDNISSRECQTRTSCHELKENGRLTSHTILRCATARPEKERESARARDRERDRATERFRPDLYHAYAHAYTHIKNIAPCTCVI
jgi:hypothetical protein